MKVELGEIERCVEGMIPPAIVTCSAAGEPNVTHLSQIQIVDDRHIAASNQFFGKTVANVTENPRACLLVHDHESGVMYRLDVRFARREHAGPTFDSLSRGIDAIAALTGMEDVFRLVSADIYEVLECEPLT